MNPPDVAIRTARPADAQSIHEVHDRSVLRLCSSHYYEHQLEVRLSGRTPEGYLPAIAQGKMFVAERGSRVVGFGHVEPGEIEAVFVDPDVAGLGIGAALLRHGLELARRGHEGSVRVVSTLNAVGFYRAHGFVEVERTEIRKRGVSMPVVVMELGSEP